MPTYEYQCEKCGNLFEVFQSMKDKKLRKCPDRECGGKVERLLGTGAGIIFKGSGFYETDYRSDGYKSAAKKEADAAKKADILSAGWKLIWAWENAVRDRHGFPSVLEALHTIRSFLHCYRNREMLPALCFYFYQLLFCLL